MKPGTVVKLKSGGPKMTVKGTALSPPDTVVCQWFDGCEKALHGEFPIVSLEPVVGFQECDPTLHEAAKRGFSGK